MKKMIILTGPTGSGKTSLSINLAKLLDTEIISADSMQVYKYMDIGTAKIKEEETMGIKHHMIDVVNPDEEFTVDDFKNKSNEIIEELNSNNKIPLIVGGSGLYIDSLIYDLEFTIAPPNYELRAYYESLAKDYGNEHLHNILKNVDPESAEKNHPNQLKRIIRALEVFDYTGQPFSSFDNKRKYLDDIDFRYLVLNRNRETLYENINNRVDQMIDDGLVEEVENLLNKGYSSDLVAMNSIGYKEIIMYLDGDISLNQAISDVKKNSRRYAKRQLTWFRRERNANFIDIEDNETQDIIFNKCLRAIEEKNEYIK